MQSVAEANPGPSPGMPAAVAADERVFGFRDQAALWFSLGVGLLVMQVGAYLVPGLGLPQAAAAIVVGSVAGAGLLAWVARIGCERGLSSAALIHLTLGSHFARLPVVLNIVQLLGWTAFELAVMRDGTAAMAKQLTGAEVSWVPWVATLGFGALLALLAMGSMVTLVRRFVGRFGLPLVIGSLVWLTWQFLAQARAHGLAELWARPGDGSMSTVDAVDLVMAMPISWLPLVADYARHGRTAASAQRGTWLGYAVANIWCYGLGALVASTVEPGLGLVTALLLAQGGLLALGLILIDELDNAYGDVYSGSVSLNYLFARLPAPRWGVILAVASVAAATVLPMHSLEPFLLMLSSVFVPLFGLIIATLATGATPSLRAVQWGPVAVWLVGVAVFHAAPVWFPGWGSALPSLVVSLGLGAVLSRVRERLPGAVTTA